MMQNKIYYRTNLLEGLQPGIKTAFYDTGNGEETRSVIFPRWDLPQCENVTVLGHPQSGPLQVTVEKPSMVNPVGSEGLTQAQLDTWCGQQLDCSSLLVQASCTAAGGLCVGLAPEAFNCESLNSTLCVQNPFAPRRGSSQTRWGSGWASRCWCPLLMGAIPAMKAGKSTVGRSPGRLR